jgi:Helix-turn-helix domain
MHDSAVHLSADGGTESEQIGYTVKRAADLLDLSERKVWYLVDQEDREPGTGIRSVKIDRSRRIPRQALLDYMNRLQSESAA